MFEFNIGKDDWRGHGGYRDYGHGHGGYRGGGFGSFLGGMLAAGVTYLLVDEIIGSDLEYNRRRYRQKTGQEMTLCSNIPPSKLVMTKKDGKDVMDCASTTDGHQVCFYWDASNEKKLSCYIP